MNLLATIKIAQAVFALIPAIIEGIKAVEVTGLPGAQKLEIVRGVLEKAYETEQKAETKFESIWPMVNTIITKLVAGYKVIKAK